MLATSVIIFWGGGTFFYSFGAFFNPIREEFQWGAATTAIAFSLFRLEGGIAAPMVGFLVDRIGPRPLMLVGAGIMGVGFILFSRINSLWSFYATFLVLSIGFSAGMGMVCMAAVSNWFVRKRSRALGVMLVGAGLSGIAARLLVWMINEFGWRDTLFYIGIATWVVCIPLALLVRHRPEGYGWLPDGDSPEASQEAGAEAKEDAVFVEGQAFRLGGEVVEVPWRQAIRTRAFWLISAAAGMAGMAISSLVVVAIPYLESVQISRETASLAIMGMTVCSLIGRLGFGWMGDYVDKRYVLAFTFGLQTAGILIFAFASSGHIWLLIPFVLVFGPGYGGSIPLRPALQADYFGRNSFGTIQGLIQAVMTFGGILGPMFAGFVFDAGGSYRPAFLVFAIVSAAAVPVILAVRRPQQTPVIAAPATAPAQPTRP